MPMFTQRRVMLVGVVLLMISMLPTVQGMISALNSISDGASESNLESQIADSVSFAMSPPFIAMKFLGILLIIVSLFLKKKP